MTEEVDTGAKPQAADLVAQSDLVGTFPRDHDVQVAHLLSDVEQPIGIFRIVESTDERGDARLGRKSDRLSRRAARSVVGDGEFRGVDAVRD